MKVEVKIEEDVVVEQPQQRRPRRGRAARPGSAAQLAEEGGEGHVYFCVPSDFLK